MAQSSQATYILQQTKYSFEICANQLHAQCIWPGSKAHFCFSVQQTAQISVKPRSIPLIHFYTSINVVTSFHIHMDDTNWLASTSFHVHMDHRNWLTSTSFHVLVDHTNWATSPWHHSTVAKWKVLFTNFSSASHWVVTYLGLRDVAQMSFLCFPMYSEHSYFFSTTSNSELTLIKLFLL